MKQFVGNCRRWLRTPAAVLLVMSAVGLVVTWGCGSRVPSGTVVGKVMVGSTPLTEANVVLCRENGATVANAPVGASGEFKFADRIPAGKYTAQIESTAPVEPPVAGEIREAPKPRFPAKYESYRTSGLTAEVRPGDNSFTFELK